jgi:hypothetical protein
MLRGALGSMSARFSANEPSLFVGSAISPTGVASTLLMADDEQMSDDVPKLTADERAAVIRVLQRSLETARFPLSPRLAPLRSALVKLDKPVPPPAPERVTAISEQLPTEPRPALYRTQTRRGHWLPIIIGVPVVVGLIAAAMYWIDQSEKTARSAPTPVPTAAAPPAPATPVATATPTPAPRFVIGIPSAQPPTPPAAQPPAPPTTPPTAPPTEPTPHLVTGLPPLGSAPSPQAEAPAAAPPPPEAEAPAAPKRKQPRTAAPPPTSGQVRF